MTTTCYECHHVETPNRMFTAGKTYPVIGMQGNCDEVMDDLGCVRCLLPACDGSARFIIRNDRRPGEWHSTPRYALFRPVPPPRRYAMTHPSILRLYDADGHKFYDSGEPSAMPVLVDTLRERNYRTDGTMLELVKRVQSMAREDATLLAAAPADRSPNTEMQPIARLLFTDPPQKSGRYGVLHRGMVAKDAFFNTGDIDRIPVGWSQMPHFGPTHWLDFPAGQMGTMDEKHPRWPQSEDPHLTEAREYQCKLAQARKASERERRTSLIIMTLLVLGLLGMAARDLLA
jgi:hypothetical protein